MNGKNIKNNYINISGLNLRENNRGTAALGYGAFYFLKEKNMLKPNDVVVTFKFYKNIFRKRSRTVDESIVECNGTEVKVKAVPVFIAEKFLAYKFGITLPFTRFGKILRNLKLVAAINGGDGFSDIYNTHTFLQRLHETKIAMKCNIPLAILPQTIGPFELVQNKKIAEQILRYAKYIYVRDDKFVSELEKMGVKYEITKDLSAYMQPQTFNIEILPNSVGLNISGLAYSNTFQSLAGQFKTYPYLINSIIRYFQKQSVPIYLIPHSYNYDSPEKSNDDLDAIKKVYENLDNKTNVHIVGVDMIAPEVKFVISKMSFFIGTRMHANFAAIYTNVPLFGLAYSYKFQGAFEANGIYNSTAMINNITEADCDEILKQIEKKYIEVKNGEIKNK